MPHSGDFAPTLILGAPRHQPPQSPPPPRFQPAPPSEAPSGPESISFTGTGSEYFRIWIVNLLLTIVTCGIYSAWAKVRKMRYFYDSTHLAGSTFEYHGNPTAILKGRIIAFILFVAYNFAPKISLLAGYGMMAIMGLVMPWLIWKSLQFKLYNSSYRGIRFGFAGTVEQAYKVYLLLPILSVFTLNLLAPFVHQRIKKFQHGESRFGTTKFSFDAPVSKFFGAYFVAIMVFIVGFGLSIVLLGFIIGAAFHSGVSIKSGKGVVTMIIGVLVLIAWGHMVYSIFMTMLQNLIWNNTKLGEHQFKSEMAWTKVVFISLTNMIAIALTLGLYTPFAKIRMMKYQIESMSMLPVGNLDGFVADTALAISATGEGVTDLLDFDFAL